VGRKIAARKCCESLVGRGGNLYDKGKSGKAWHNGFKECGKEREDQKRRMETVRRTACGAVAEGH